MRMVAGLSQIRRRASERPARQQSVLCNPHRRRRTVIAPATNLMLSGACQHRRAACVRRWWTRTPLPSAANNGVDELCCTRAKCVWWLDSAKFGGGRVSALHDNKASCATLTGGAAPLLRQRRILCYPAPANIGEQRACVAGGLERHCHQRPTMVLTNCVAHGPNAYGGWTQPNSAAGE